MNYVRKIVQISLVLLFMIFFGLNITTAFGNEDFVTIWKTDNAGFSSDTQIKIPTSGRGYNYNVDCDNDGVIDLYNQKRDVVCNYPSAGIYTVRISGDFPKIRFGKKNTDKNKILSVSQWGNGAWTSMRKAFFGCSNLGIATGATDIPDLSKVKGMYAMFAGASSFDEDIGNWDVSNVTDMNKMFYKARKFNQDIGDRDVGSVTKMTRMFQGATLFDQNLGDWDMKKVSNINRMFNYISLSINNYDGLLIGRSNQVLKNGLSLSVSSEYYAGGVAKQNIIDNYGWSIVDNGMADSLSTLIVEVPTSDSMSIIETEFVDKGYLKGNGSLKPVHGDTLVGKRRVNLKRNKGKLLVPVVLKSADTLTEVSFPQGAILEKSGVGFTGVLNLPVDIPVDDIDGLLKVQSAISVGDGDVGTILIKDSYDNSLPVTIRMPSVGAAVGSFVDIYYTENGMSDWILHGHYEVVDIGGVPYIEFDTTHFTDFAVTLSGGGLFTGSFAIDNDNATTSSQDVELNISTTPVASQMRFSNDGVSRSTREVYASTKSWILTTGYEIKTVYVQFDADGDSISDVELEDTIYYGEAGGNGESHVTVTISKPNASCSSYFGDYDFGTQIASYSITSLTGSNLDNLSCVWVSDNHSINVATSTVNLEGVATSYNIPFTNLELLATTFTADNNSVCNWSSTAYDTLWMPSTVSHVYLEKIADGKTCDYTLDSPNLTLDIPANQAADTYTGKIVFTIVE